MLKTGLKSLIIKIISTAFIAVLLQPVLFAETQDSLDTDFQIKPKYSYSNKVAKDPFMPKYKKSRTLTLSETVDISTLMLIGITESGGDMAALFRSRLGDPFGYILMGSRFYGSNDIEIPDILGEIKSSTEVVLRQGDKEILFTLDDSNITTSIRPTETEPEK